MIRRANIAATASLLVLISSAVPSQELPSALSENPFSRPDFVVTLGEARPLLTGPMQLELRATLLADGQALANINGEILAAGQMYEDYRVLQIAEGQAVLIKDGVRLVLDLYDNQPESDADRD